MNDSGTLQVATPSDREIAMIRVLDAPRSLVFDAWTKPELVKRWLGVREGWSLAVCEIDLRVSGAYRFVWQHEDGAELGMGGTYREVSPPERLVSTERFDVAWYAGDALNTMVLVEEDGKTTVTVTVLYDSLEIRDSVLESGMTRGVAQSYDKLADVLSSAPATQSAR